MHLKTPLLLIVALMFILPSASSGEEQSSAETWRPDPAKVERYMKSRRGVQAREEAVPEYTLPVILSSDGDWHTRRAELVELFEKHVYGRAIPKPESLKTEAVEETQLSTIPRGVCQRQRVTATMENGPFSFEYLLFAVEGEQRPVFVMINNRDPELALPDGENFSGFVPVKQILDAGFALAVFQHNDVAPDNQENFREGILNVVLPAGPRKSDAPGTIAAWSWGASRVLDSLEGNQLVDASNAAIIGHSRGGKTALWTGALDPRFSLVISNNSGCMGAAISRRRFGETVGVIGQRFERWFCPEFQQYADQEDELPVEQHQLIALSAPRHVYVASADEDLWADPRGEWLGLANAHTAFDSLGAKSITPEMTMPALNQPRSVGATSYHIRTGGHDLTEWDWQQYLAVATRLWNSN